MTSEQRLIEFFARPKESKTKVLDRAIAEILDDDISAATKATLLKQIEQPLPDVKAGNEIQDATIEAPNMRGQGQPGARMNRQARLLEPSGNPDVFKVVSLVLGTPEFQRQ